MELLQILHISTLHRNDYKILNFHPQHHARYINIEHERQLLRVHLWSGFYNIMQGYHSS